MTFPARIPQLARALAADGKSLAQATPETQFTHRTGVTLTVRDYLAWAWYFDVRRKDLRQ